VDRKTGRMLAFLVYLGLAPEEVAGELARLGIERALAIETVLAALRQEQEEEIGFARAVIEREFALEGEWEVNARASADGTVRVTASVPNRATGP
jgi:hypothetical protein